MGIMIYLLITFQRQVEVSQIMEGYMQVLLDKDTEPENEVEMKMQLTMIG